MNGRKGGRVNDDGMQILCYRDRFSPRRERNVFHFTARPPLLLLLLSHTFSFENIIIKRPVPSLPLLCGMCLAHFLPSSSLLARRFIGHFLHIR